MRVEIFILLIGVAACSKKEDKTIWLDGSRTVEVEAYAKETATPQANLHVNADMGESKFGQRTFTGNIANMAHATAYRDIQVTFHFLDSAYNEIGAHTFATKDAVEPGKKLGFKVKLFVPDSTVHFKCTVTALAK